MPGLGDTAAETRYVLQGVAEAFIQSYLEREVELLGGVAATPMCFGEPEEVTVIA